MSLSFGLEGTHVLITGGAGLIGKEVVHIFVQAGARVSSLDISNPNDQWPYQSTSPEGELYRVHADVSSEESLQIAFAKAAEVFGPPSACISIAALDLSVLEHHESIADVPVEQFRRTLDVNVTGTFLLAREWVKGLRNAHADGVELKNVSFTIVGSESGHWGEPHNPDYATSKTAVQYGLLQSLRQEVPKVYPGARANAIAPGPVDTPRFKEECKANPVQYYEDCVATTAMAKPVAIEHVARSILYLASEAFSGAVHGQILNVDSGKLGKLVHHVS